MPITLPADADVLRKHSSWFITYGAIVIVLGALAIVVPGVATLAVTLMVGWLLLFGGAFGLFAVISGGQHAPGFWWNLATTIVYFLAGLAVLTRPNGILIGGDTYRLVRRWFEGERVRVEVKGRAEPVTAFRGDVLLPSSAPPA